MLRKKRERKRKPKEKTARISRFLMLGLHSVVPLALSATNPLFSSFFSHQLLLFQIHVFEIHVSLPLDFSCFSGSIFILVFSPRCVLCNGGIVLYLMRIEFCVWGVLFEVNNWLPGCSMLLFGDFKESLFLFYIFLKIIIIIIC